MSTPLDARTLAAVAAHERLPVATVRTIADAAVAHDVDPMLLLAIAKQETDFGRSPAYDRATGTGDGGHGHGVFQLDDRTPSHRADTAAVEHDLGRSSEIAAGMVRGSLDRANGSERGALRAYNSGSVHGRTTRTDYHGERVPYETMVEMYRDRYRTSAGLATGTEPPHPAATPHAELAPAAQRGTAQFIRSEHVLRTVDAAGHVREFAAYNNTTNPHGDPNVPESHGPAPDGRFPLRAFDRSYANGESGSYGPVGAVHIGGATPSARGLLIHSGRGNDPAHATYGCIRTTDEAMRFLRDHPMHELTIEEHRTPEQSRPGEAQERAAHPHAAPHHHTAPAWRVPGDRHGALAEPMAEKDRLLTTAIANAKHGHAPVFAFTRAAGESAATVTMQNELLDRAVALHLPAHARAAFVAEKHLDLGPTIVGEHGFDGRPLETAAELEGKNAHLQRAIVEAKHGIVESHDFVGNGRETRAGIAAQNAVLHQQIAKHLPPAERAAYEARHPELPHERGPGAAPALDERARAAVARYNGAQSGTPLPAPATVTTWDGRGAISGTALPVEGGLLVNAGRGAYTFVDAQRLHGPVPTQPGFVEITRSGAITPREPATQAR